MPTHNADARKCRRKHVADALKHRQRTQMPPRSSSQHATSTLLQGTGALLAAPSLRTNRPRGKRTRSRIAPRALRLGQARRTLEAGAGTHEVEGLSLLLLVADESEHLPHKMRLQVSAAD